MAKKASQEYMDGDIYDRERLMDEFQRRYELEYRSESDGGPSVSSSSTDNYGHEHVSNCGCWLCRLDSLREGQG